MGQRPFWYVAWERAVTSNCAVNGINYSAPYRRNIYRFDFNPNLSLQDGFETLHLRLYQLDRLIEEYLPELWSHLVESAIESHMYASQWFLTLFTAKFPLFLVFHILDVFLYQGMDTIFQV